MSSATCLTETTADRSNPTTPLLAAVAAGDEGAMAAVWSAYAGPIRGLARSLSKVAFADADDVVQETLTKVWKAASSFDPSRGTEATFVFTVARRVIIDRWRKIASKSITSSFDDRVPCVDDRAAGAFDLILIKGQVRDAIGSLSPLQRQVIEMAYLQGLSQSEISARLDVPLGTVKTRTFAALRALRPLLADSDAMS